MQNILYRIKRALNKSDKSNYHSISYMIANIIDFAALAEHLTPENLFDLVNKYVSNVESIVSKNQGTVEKVVGDHVSSYWIHQDETDFKTNNVLRAAREIIQRKEEIHPQLDLSIGIATGNAFWVGDSYIGNVCNNAIKLLEMNKTSQKRILFCEVTNSHQDIFKTQRITSKLSGVYYVV
jgi:class 3 adenylate cyclase